MAQKQKESPPVLSFTPSLVAKQRTCLGWNQDKLAERADISVRTVQLLEQGKSHGTESIIRVNNALRKGYSDDPGLREQRIEYRDIRQFGREMAIGAESSPQSTDADDNQNHIMSWETYFAAVRELSGRVMAHPVRGGFRPQIVLGVNYGGAIVGGMLYATNRRSFHFSSLWSDFDHSTAPPAWLYELQSLLSDGRGDTRRILLVDDSAKTCTVMRRTVGLLRAYLALDFEVKSAVIVYRAEFNTANDGFCPDFFIYDAYEQFPYGSV